MNKQFWKAAGIRALRTFIQAILAVWTVGMKITEVDWKVALLTGASAAVYSFLTSIVTSLPEVQLQDTLYTLDNEADEEYIDSLVDVVDEDYLDNLSDIVEEGDE